MVKYLILFLSLIFCAHSAEVKLKFPLTLGGDFVGKANIHNGEYVKKGSKLFAKNMYVKVSEIKTGVSLRDNHVHKKLKFKKFPKVEILKAIGSGGKGTALVKIRGVKKKVPFKYKEKKNKVDFDFEVALKDFKIDRKKEGFVYLGVGIKEKVKISGNLNRSFNKLAQSR